MTSFFMRGAILLVLFKEQKTSATEEGLAMVQLEEDNTTT
jgi:hypothetical protein